MSWKYSSRYNYRFYGVLAGLISWLIWELGPCSVCLMHTSDDDDDDDGDFINVQYKSQVCVYVVFVCENAC